jgi:RNA polymerase sigma-70 factor (ECF subfamily)
VDDTDLLARAIAGEEAAFDLIVERHAGRLYRNLRFLCASPAQAEEALQETFLAAWRGMDRFSGRSTVRTWLLGIARHQAARTWRLRAGEGRLGAAEPGEPASEEQVEDNESLLSLGLAAGWGRSADPEAFLMALQDHELLDSALRGLPAADREVIVLCDLEELRATEAAELLGIRPPALKSRLHRARLRLMAALQPEVSHG